MFTDVAAKFGTPDFCCRNSVSIIDYFREFSQVQFGCVVNFVQTIKMVTFPSIRYQVRHIVLVSQASTWYWYK